MKPGTRVRTTVFYRDREAFTLPPESEGTVESASLLPVEARPTNDETAVRFMATPKRVSVIATAFLEEIG